MKKIHIEILLFVDLLEGLKRAQRFRLEDQRGTEINFELPDFLKDSGGRSKLRKVKQMPTDGNTIQLLPVTSPVKSPVTSSPIEDSPRKSLGKAPQPAPRLSISRQYSSPNNNDKNVINSNENDSTSPTTKSPQNNFVHEELYSNSIESSAEESPQKYHNGNEPPPLPPKPKIKPSYWMNGNANGGAAASSTTADNKKLPSPRTIYLDQPNSSFV